MKLVALKAIRLGNRRYAEGDEFEWPDRYAASFIRAGQAVEATGKKPAKKKAEPEPEAKDKKTYKTRQVKAED